MPSCKAFQSANSAKRGLVASQDRAAACRAASQDSQAASRRSLLAGVAGISGIAALPLAPEQVQAFGPLTSKGKKSSKKIPISEYSILDNGLKFYDLEEGSGGAVKKGDTVSVHFDVYYGIIDVVSSRYATLLGKNELIPEPYDFTAGTSTKERKAAKAEGGIAGGSFAGAAGPKPPPALSTSVIGMKKGGKRSVMVPAEQAYGDKGYDEIPPGATIELQIEVL